MMLDAFKKDMQGLEPMRQHRYRKPYCLSDILPESSLRPHNIELENTSYPSSEALKCCLDKKGQEVNLAS